MLIGSNLELDINTLLFQNITHAKMSIIYTDRRLYTNTKISTNLHARLRARDIYFEQKIYILFINAHGFKHIAHLLSSSCVVLCPHTHTHTHTYALRDKDNWYSLTSIFIFYITSEYSNRFGDFTHHNNHIPLFHNLLFSFVIIYLITSHHFLYINSLWLPL